MTKEQKAAYDKIYWEKRYSGEKKKTYLNSRREEYNKNIFKKRQRTNELYDYDKKKEYYNKTKLIQKNSTLKRKFGITLEQYNDIFIKQEGKCAICGKQSWRKLAVDHEHKTGVVRGLLCHNCNLALGLMFDNKVFLNNAIRYLEKNGAENGSNAGTSSETPKRVSDQSVQIYLGSPRN